MHSLVLFTKFRSWRPNEAWNKTEKSHKRVLVISSPNRVHARTKKREEERTKSGEEKTRKMRFKLSTAVVSCLLLAACSVSAYNLGFRFHRSLHVTLFALLGRKCALQVPVPGRAEFNNGISRGDPVSDFEGLELTSFLQQPPTNCNF